MLDTVHGFWHGPMSTMERLCISSFLKNGHRFELYSYAFDEYDYDWEDLELPIGVIPCDARNILPEGELFSLYGSYSSFSDHFRYALMSKVDGWWTDLDVVCLKPLELGDYAFLSEDSKATNAIFRVPPHNELMPLCFSRAERLPLPIEADGEIVWNGDKYTRGFCDAGWGLYHQALLDLNLEQYIHSKTLHIGQPIDFIADNGVIPDAYAIHFCAFGWRGGGRRIAVDKDGSYPASSIYEQLKARYL